MSSTPSSSGIAGPKKHPETPDEGRAGRRRRQRLDRRGEGQVGGRRRAANSLPARGEAVRELGLALPPARMKLCVTGDRSNAGATRAFTHRSSWCAPPRPTSARSASAFGRRRSPTAPARRPPGSARAESTGRSPGTRAGNLRRRESATSSLAHVDIDRARAGRRPRGGRERLAERTARVRMDAQARRGARWTRAGRLESRGGDQRRRREQRTDRLGGRKAKRGRPGALRRRPPPDPLRARAVSFASGRGRSSRTARGSVSCAATTASRSGLRRRAAGRPRARRGLRRDRAPRGVVVRGTPRQSFDSR